MNTNKSNKFNFLKDDFSEAEAKDGEEQHSSSQSSPESSPSKRSTTSSSKIAKKAASATPKTKKTQSRQQSESVKKTPTRGKSRKPEPIPEIDEKTGKRSNPNYKTVGVLLPKQAHKKAKILLMDDEQERDFSTLMTQLLEQWLEDPDL